MNDESLHPSFDAYNETLRSMYERAIGEKLMDYSENLRPDELFHMVENDALDLISEIKEILDSDTLDDPECFHRIEAIVNAFESKGIQVYRHD